MSELQARCGDLCDHVFDTIHRVTQEFHYKCAIWEGLNLPREQTWDEADDEDDEDAAQRDTEHGDDDESGAGYRAWAEACGALGVMC